MRDTVHPTRRTRSPSAPLLALATLATAFPVAGCGASTPSPTVASVRTATTSNSSAPSNGTATASTSNTATRGHGNSSGSTAPSTGGSGPLAFAKCMRANGVPNFPDPSPTPGALFNTTGIDTSAPAFLTASAKCHRLTGGGPPIPGSKTHPSERTLLKLRKIAVCMRAHGISEFPDPTTTVPSNPGPGVNVIANFDGVIMLLPPTLNLQAPAYKQALAACGAPPLGLPH